jgi:formylglycine-generating enzyme required for sulfatase activity
MSEQHDRPQVPIVFISSTVEDLRPYRDAARDAAVGAEFLPRMQEYFAASGGQTPLAACLSEVSETDVLVVIVAHRYGWTPPDQPGQEHKSITWLECEQAIAEGKEVLAFLVADRQPWPEEQREEFRLTAALREGRATPGLLADVQRSLERLGDFKAWLNSRVIRVEFTTPEDLRGRVSDALRDWRDRHPQYAAAAAGAAPGPSDPSRYLRALQDQTGYIDVRGLQVGTGRAHRFPIEDLFISLTTAMAPEAREGKVESRKPSGGTRGRALGMEVPERRAVPLHAALSNRRLVVVGDPGSGKTTFLRRVTHALCQSLLGENPRAAEDRLGIQGRPLPVLVRLAELWEHMAEPKGATQGSRRARPESATWLPRFLAAAGEDERWGLDEAYFRGRLERGSCLVLLDGLDEAPSLVARESLARFIENLARAYDTCGIVVTSRPAAYTGGVVLPEFAHAEIEPLDQQAIGTFLQRWCEGLYPESPSDAATHRDELVTAIACRPEIRRIARNPVMLTALAVLQWNEKRLPEQRADLYDSILKWLARQRGRRPGRETADRSLVLLQGLALAMQNDRKGRQVQVTRRGAAEAIEAHFAGRDEGERIEQAERFLSEEEVDSGIVVGRGNELRFWHLIFQEFLAARAIAGRPDAEQRKLLVAGSRKIFQPEWRETILLLAGVLHQQGAQKVDGLLGAVLDTLEKRATFADRARCAGLLGAVRRDLEPLDYRPTDRRLDKLFDDVLAIFDRTRSRLIPLETRIEAADALGQAGDPRLEPGDPRRWVPIPAGPFRMGAQKAKRSQPNYDPDASRWESPDHEVCLDAYRLDRFPVTVSDYRRFIEDGGHENERWWEAGAFGRWKSPDGWEEQLAYPSRPVVGVSWFEAAAYCAWAGCRLPTEAEWERAARGTEGRRFPWGAEPPEPSRLNFSESRIGHPTPVGVYPLGATPDEILDMAGNVWEWCADWFSEDYYAASPRENPRGPESGKGRVLRGGSWHGGAGGARSSIRGRVAPDGRDVDAGFRVVAGGGVRTR